MRKTKNKVDKKHHRIMDHCRAIHNAGRVEHLEEARVARGAAGGRLPYPLTLP